MRAASGGPSVPSSLERKLIPWAEEKTRTEGRFTITAATEELGLSRTEAERVVRGLISARRVEQGGRKGFRVVGIELPLTAKGWVTPELNERRRVFLVDWTRDETMRTGHFTAEGTAAATGLPLVRTQKLLTTLRREGAIERLPGDLGYRATGVEGPDVSVRAVPTTWTPEALQKLEDRLLDYASTRTEAEGGFTITAAAAVLNDGVKGPIETIVRKWREEGRVAFLNRHHGFALVGVDRSERYVPRQTPDAAAERAELREWVIGETQTATAETGRATVEQLAALRGNTNREPLFEIMRELAAEGLVVQRGGPLGWSWVEDVPPCPTISDLKALAKGNVEETPSSRGRQGYHKKREVSTVSGSQEKDIKWLLGKLQERVRGDALAPEDFRWDPAADGGSGNWALLARIRKWGESASATPKLVRAAELVLDLAATHGLIERSDRDRSTHVIHAPGWIPEINRWESQIQEEQGERASGKVRTGCRVLARYATRLGYESEAYTDWNRVRAMIERDWELWEESDHQEGLRTSQRDAARYVWKRLPQLEEGVEIWPSARDSRRGLVHNSAIRKTVANHEDFSGWVSQKGEPYEGLVGGSYGVEMWLKWATASPNQLSHEGLPPRQWPRPTDDQEFRMKRERKKGNDLFRCSGTTIKTKLGRVVGFAGWAEDHDGYDPLTEDLRALCDVERLKRYDRWLESNRRMFDIESVAADKDRGSHRVARILSTMASPFLEAQALKACDTDVADRMLESAQALRKYSHEQKPIGNEYKIVTDIYDKWSEAQRDGYLKLDDLIEAILTDAEDRLGLSLEQVLERVENSDWTAPLWWAKLIRDALLITVVRKVPFRSRTASFFSLDEWENLPATPDQFGRELAPWEGAIRFSLSASKMKSRKAFKPPLIPEELVGNPDAEAEIRRPLIQAYFMDGGAREVLLTVSGEDKPRSSPYVFVPMAAAGRGSPDDPTRTKDERWKAVSISANFRTLVQRYGPAIGLNVGKLKKMWGAMTFHVIRLLFGTYWTRRGRAYEASKLLQHHSVPFTLKLYAGQDERHATLYVTASMREESKDHVARLNDRMAEVTAQNALFVEQIGQLTSTLRALTETQDPRGPAWDSDAGSLYLEELQNLLRALRSGLISQPEFDSAKATLNAQHEVAA